jgi:hypothetical protein
MLLSGWWNYNRTVLGDFMTRREIDDLRHWNFIELYNDNTGLYKKIYDDAYASTQQRIGRPPSINDMEDALPGMLLQENNFIDHCDSKNSYNPDFNIDCARKFARFIVFVLYWNQYDEVLILMEDWIMEEISQSTFIQMAEEMAARWEEIVETVNKEGGKVYFEPRKAALNPTICSHIRIVSAMNILNRYYAVRPDSP